MVLKAIEFQSSGIASRKESVLNIFVLYKLIITITRSNYGYFRQIMIVLI